MRMELALAVAAAHFGAAQNNTMPNNPNGEITGYPNPIGAFEFYGCVKSDNGFPGFERVSTNTEMTLEFCAASCETKYFGVQDTDCYCGKELDEAKSSRVDLNKCNERCPGNPEERCGGIYELLRRDIPINILLTVYSRRGDDNGEATITRTITTTSTGTITACPETVTDCPVGQPTTHIGVYTTAYCPEPTPDYKKIVCYGDECFYENECDTCAHNRVVCRDGHCFVEECETEDYNRLVICEGENCEYATGQKGKVVCYDETCDIQQCNGYECQEKIVNHEACNGATCPAPAPPAPTPAPPCYGPECVHPAPPSGNKTYPPPVIAGAGSILPSAVAVLGLVAGVAALL